MGFYLALFASIIMFVNLVFIAGQIFINALSKSIKWLYWSIIFNYISIASCFIIAFVFRDVSWIILSIILSLTNWAAIEKYNALI